MNHSLYTKHRASSTKCNLIHIPERYFYWGITIWYLSTQCNKLLYKVYIISVSTDPTFLKHFQVGICSNCVWENIMALSSWLIGVDKTLILLSVIAAKTGEIWVYPLVEIMGSTKLVPCYLFILLQLILKSDCYQVTCHIDNIWKYKNALL